MASLHEEHGLSPESIEATKRNMIRNLKEEGWSIDQLAAVFNCTVEDIAKYLS